MRNMCQLSDSNFQLNYIGRLAYAVFAASFNLRLTTFMIWS